MKKTKVILFIALILLVCWSQVLVAGSIWAKRNKNMKNLYSDDVAHSIGDILTINIVEESTVDNKAKRDMEKSDARSTVFNGELGKFADIGEFGFSASSNNKLNGKADYKDERSFEDCVTVMVIDVLPTSGNLVVMGTRERTIAGDTQKIEISGVVRPSDISFNNSISSQQVANFSIVSKNSGVADSYTKPGWLGNIMNKISPF